MAIIQTTINFLRTDTGSFSTTDRYYVSDDGMEGFWKYIGTDLLTTDNTGLILTNPQNPASGTLRKVFERIYDGYICVSWFGAKGDGLTNNTTAIQLAIDTLKVISGGILYFGKGIFLTSTLSIHSSTLTNRDKINLKGAGKMSTIIKGYPRMQLAGYIKTKETASIPLSSPLNPLSIPIIEMIGPTTAFISIFDLTIIGDLESGNYYIETEPEIVFYIDTGFTYDGISANNQVLFEIGNVEIKGCETCFIGNSCLDFHIHDFLFGGSDRSQNSLPYESSNYGIKLTRADGMSANAIRISNGTIKCCKNIGLQFSHGNLLNVSQVVFEQNGTYIEGSELGAIILNRDLNDYNPEVDHGNFVSIINIMACWFEKNDGYTIFLADPTEEDHVDNILINISNSFFAKMNSDVSLGVYLGLIPWPANAYPSFISKVNIYGTASKLPVFEIKAYETIVSGSFIEQLVVNGTSTIIVNTPAFIANRNYLLDN